MQRGGRNVVTMWYSSKVSSSVTPNSNWGGDFVLNLADSHTWYGWMKHTEIPMSCQSLKVRQTILTMLLKTIRKFHFCLSTGYEDSASYYIREGGSPFQGGFQENGTAPAIWLAQSRILIKLMRKWGSEETLSKGYYLINISLVAFMFVYDTDLFNLGKPIESV